MRLLLISIMLHFPLVVQAGEVPLWRTDRPGDSMQAFQEANVRAFWALMSELSLNDPRGWLEYEGWILGDAHLGNYGGLPSEQGWAYLPNDLDDAGWGPLLADLLRFLLSANAHQLSSENEFISIYMEALCGIVPVFPSEWSSALMPSPSTKDWNFHSRHWRMSPMGRQEREYLEKFLPPGKTVKTAITSRPRGGSQNSPRYWLMRESPTGTLHHYEFKLMAEPATALYLPQAPHRDRLQQSKKVFWPDSHQNTYQVVQMDNKDFLLRERRVDPFRDHPNQLSQRKKRELAFYALQVTAYRQGQQPGGQELCRRIQNNPMLFREDLDQLLKQLTQAETQAHQQNHRDSFPIQIRGDLRYRYEHRTSTLAEPRAQNKLRARLGARFLVTPRLHAQIGMSTGRHANSSNARMGESFEGKDFYLNQASFGWYHPKGAEIELGKLEQNFLRVGQSELIWDSTLTPEGVHGQFERMWQMNHLRWRSGAYIYSENYRGRQGIDQPNQDIHFVQFSLERPLAWGLWQIGVGLHHFNQIKGTRERDLARGSSLGNTLSASDQYLYNYHVQEFFLSARGPFTKSSAIELFHHQTQNSAAPANNSAFYQGLTLHGRPLSWTLARREVPLDAVFGPVTESNFGLGGTGQKGWESRLDFRHNHALRSSLRYQKVKNRLGESQNEIERWHLDLRLRF